EWPPTLESFHPQATSAHASILPCRVANHEPANLPRPATNAHCSPALSYQPLLQLPAHQRMVCQSNMINTREIGDTAQFPAFPACTSGTGLMHQCITEHNINPVVLRFGQQATDHIMPGFRDQRLLNRPRLKYVAP